MSSTGFLRREESVHEAGTDAASGDAAYASLLAERDRIAARLDLLDRALHASSSHFLIIDLSQEPRRVAYANRALAVRHGFELNELIGMDLERFRQQIPRTAAIDAAMREGRDLRTEIHMRAPDGSPLSLEISISPVRSADGRVTHYVSIANDITTHIQKERQLQHTVESQTKEQERLAMELRLAQKLEAVGRLASGIAHEINTPIQYVGDSIHFLKSAMDDMNGIVAAYRDALQRVADGADATSLLAELQQVEAAVDIEFVVGETPKAFERTMDGIGRVTALVQAMKEFAHPRGNEQSPADINHALDTTLAVAKNEYKYCASVITRFAELPPVVCNINEINQVFLNLIVNAAHAIHASDNDATKGRIEIATAHVGESVEIVIADNGCGIPAAHLEKIFDPFFTTKPVGKGTGQGLALARSIVVEKHDGQIDVQSTLGVGTRFIVRLPVAGKPPAKSG